KISLGRKPALSLSLEEELIKYCIALDKRYFGLRLKGIRHLAFELRLKNNLWICVVRKADFSDVNVFLVASVPGIHKAVEADFWGYKKLAYVLSCNVTLSPDAQWPIVAQSSAVGCFGSTIESWLLKDIIRCMSKEISMGLKNHPQFQFIYTGTITFLIGEKETCKEKDKYWKIIEQKFNSIFSTEF
ncbi:putative tyrosyl-DNA phosphodiesterase, partial [Trachymyrmex cornetzi]